MFAFHKFNNFNPFMSLFILSKEVRNERLVIYGRVLILLTAK